MSIFLPVSNEIKGLFFLIELFAQFIFAFFLFMLKEEKKKISKKFN